MLGPINYEAIDIVIGHLSMPIKEGCESIATSTCLPSQSSTTCHCSYSHCQSRMSAQSRLPMHQSMTMRCMQIQGHGTIAVWLKRPRQSAHVHPPRPPLQQAISQKENNSHSATVNVAFAHGSEAAWLHNDVVSIDAGDNRTRRNSQCSDQSGQHQSAHGWSSGNRGGHSRRQ